MARKLASVLIVALMGVPPSIRALGLGELDSDSNLNEPLSARIPLLSIRDNDPVSIHVSLASPDAFKRAGLDRPYYLSRLKFEVKQGSGGYYILVSTDAPLKEPFLDFLLNVRWPQGDLQREYTVLLNPPQYSAGELSTPVQSGAVAVHRAPPQQDASPAPYSSPAQVAVTGEPRGGAREITRYGPVQANQTLWGIASEVRPSGDITVYQTMQALLQDNPGAFIDGNINALLKGSVLRVPTRAVIARIDAKEAALHIRGQLAHWRQTHSNDEAVAAQGQTSTQARPEEQTDNGGKEVAAAATLPSKGRLRVMAARDEAAAQATPSI
ncbi:MAG TPA: FimV/HubP family polar landmark protein, partial [Nitrococcus sp.]|nr:FimV/HubP family polar landmark protein [Nitrococcus sp.]